MKIGILGGGLTGLVVASAVKNHECEVLEADGVVGGHCRSLVEDGYTFDLGGPHIIYSKNADTLALIKEKLGDNWAERERKNVIWYNGRYVGYPFENHLGDLEPQERYECVRDFPGWGYRRTFQDWLYGHFGRSIAGKYLIPYNRKIWNCDLLEMESDWCSSRIPRPSSDDVLKSACGIPTVGYKEQARFIYPKRGGIESLPQAFAKGVNVRQVRVGPGTLLSHYDKVVSTIPIDDLWDLYGKGVTGLRYNSLITVMLGIDFNIVTDRYTTAVYVPDPEIPFHRLSFPRSFCDDAAPGYNSAIMAEITTNPGDGFHEMNDGELVEEVYQGLLKMQGGYDNPGPYAGPRKNIVFARVHRTKHAYVVPTHGYRERLKTCLDYLDSLGIISVGRNAQHEYINMDEAIRRGLEVAKQLDALEVPA